MQSVRFIWAALETVRLWANTVYYTASDETRCVSKHMSFVLNVGVNLLYRLKEAIFIVTWEKVYNQPNQSLLQKE